MNKLVLNGYLIRFMKWAREDYETVGEIADEQAACQKMRSLANEAASKGYFDIALALRRGANATENIWRR
jgi:hypothetical protein